MNSLLLMRCALAPSPCLAIRWPRAAMAHGLCRARDARGRSPLLTAYIPRGDPTGERRSFAASGSAYLATVTPTALQYSSQYSTQ